MLREDPASGGMCDRRPGRQILRFAKDKFTTQHLVSCAIVVLPPDPSLREG
jgi:hypothetical protein